MAVLLSLLVSTITSNPFLLPTPPDKLKATSIFNGDLYAATPAGWVLAHCVYDIPGNAEIEKHNSTTLVRLISGELKTVPQCLPKVNSENPVLRRNNARSESARQSRQLPPDYDGWLQYAAFNHTPSFDTMTNLMSVPDVPKAVPQILYFFPGLQNYDWIPKVDPEPTLRTPFDIIQPVLQYPGFSPDAWGVRSWYVTIHAGALQSELLPVAVGDNIMCNMTRTGAKSWFIGAKLPDGKFTNQKVNDLTPGASTRMRFQPWAYVTLECYGCRGCSTYPEQPIVFSDIKLTADGEAIIPIWRPNPKPQPHQMCKENTTVEGPDKITISFQ